MMPNCTYIDSKWYVYFTGNDNNLDNRCIYVLENDSPDPLKGTFRLKGRIDTDKENHVAMFSTVFQQDGRFVSGAVRLAFPQGL